MARIAALQTGILAFLGTTAYESQFVNRLCVFLCKETGTDHYMRLYLESNIYYQGSKVSPYNTPTMSISTNPEMSVYSQVLTGMLIPYIRPVSP